jgi:hypothetical protein
MGTRLGVGPEALADYAAFSMGQSEVLPSQVWDGEQKYTASLVVCLGGFTFDGAFPMFGLV